MDPSDIQLLLSAPPQVLCIVFLLVLGWLLKQTPWIKDEYIPAILSVFGIVAFCGLLGVNVNNIILGFIAGTSATGSHQIPKQLLKPKDSTDQSGEH